MRADLSQGGLNSLITHPSAHRSARELVRSVRRNLAHKGTFYFWADRGARRAQIAERDDDAPSLTPLAAPHPPRRAHRCRCRTTGLGRGVGGGGSATHPLTPKMAGMDPICATMARAYDTIPHCSIRQRNALCCRVSPPRFCGRSVWRAAGRRARVRRRHAPRCSRCLAHSSVLRGASSARPGVAGGRAPSRQPPALLHSLSLLLPLPPPPPPPPRPRRSL